MRAIEVRADGSLGLIDADPPIPGTGQVLVDVNAISINRGEVFRARAAGAGFRPGWDFTGVVREACETHKLTRGMRVAGFIPAGAWAETLAVSPRQIAAIPDGVSDAVAASLPVAGLTALGAIDAGGNLVGRKVLVTGATGGVGSFAVHLATLSGAQVTAVVRRSPQDCRHMLPGDTQIVCAQGNLNGVSQYGPFDLIVETLGGTTLGEAMGMLTHNGKCVTLGVTDDVKTHFDAEQFFMTGSASLQGFVLFRDRLATPAEGMERLLYLADVGKLSVHIGVLEDWSQIEAVAEKFIARSFTGKAVLTLGGDRR